MSILIRGMEMPTSCRACHLKMNCDDCEGWECVCVPLRQQIGYLCDLPTEKRRDDCPLVPVPSHGRLIDADALIELIAFEMQHYVVKDEFDKGRVAAWNNVIHVIREYAPTIVPAEEGE